MKLCQLFIHESESIPSFPGGSISEGWGGWFESEEDYEGGGMRGAYVGDSLGQGQAKGRGLWKPKQPTWYSARPNSSLPWSQSGFFPDPCKKW